MSIRTVTYCDVCKKEFNDTSKKLVPEADRLFINKLMAFGVIKETFEKYDDICEDCVSAIVFAAKKCATDRRLNS